MSTEVQAAVPSRRRRRHRSPRRKLAEGIALIVGVPLLLFTVLALSVELIEYRPVGAPVAEPSPPRPAQPAPRPRVSPAPLPSAFDEAPAAASSLARERGATTGAR